MLSDLREEIQLIPDLVDLAHINASTYFNLTMKVSHRENSFVVVPQMEDTVIIWPQELLVVHMVAWPSVEVKRHIEDFGFQDPLDLDILLYENRQVLKENEARHIVVLILDDVVYDDIHSPDLVIFESHIDAIGVEES